MALDPSNSSNLEQVALKGLIMESIQTDRIQLKSVVAIGDLAIRPKKDWETDDSQLAAAVSLFKLKTPLVSICCAFDKSTTIDYKSMTIHNKTDGV